MKKILAFIIVASIGVLSYYAIEKNNPILEFEYNGFTLNKPIPEPYIAIKDKIGEVPYLSKSIGLKESTFCLPTFDDEADFFCIGYNKYNIVREITLIGFGKWKSNYLIIKHTKPYGIKNFTHTKNSWISENSNTYISLPPNELTSLEQFRFKVGKGSILITVGLLGGFINNGYITGNIITTVSYSIY